MRTWKEITGDIDFEPQYLRLDIKVGDTTQSVVGILIEARMDCSDLPSEWHAYSLRHHEDDWSHPISIERVVAVNFLGRFLTDCEITFPSEDYSEGLEVIDYSYEDWTDVAYDALEAAGADLTEIDLLVSQWNNLDTPVNNIKRLMSPSLRHPNDPKASKASKASKAPNNLRVPNP